VSGALPGSTHDLAAVRIWGVLRELAATGLIVLADKGYTGAVDPVRTPTADAASPLPRRTPTAPTPGSAVAASAPTLSSEPDASCANSAAAPWRAGQVAKAIHVLRIRETTGRKTLTETRSCAIGQ
jgi:hypothetical protein